MPNFRLQNTIAAIALVLALLVLIFQSQVWDFIQEISISYDNRPVIAEVITLNRNVKFRLPESLTYYRAKSNMGLRARDTLWTDSNSTAVIQFKSGLRVEVQPNSLIVIEDMGNSSETVEVSFLRGNVRILNEDRGLRVSANKALLKKLQPIEAAPPPLIPTPQLKIDVAALEKSMEPTHNLSKISIQEKKEELKKLALPLKKKQVIKEILPDSYITGVIKNQRTFLNRCYAQHLRLNPDARGRIDLSITIEPDGSISATRVLASTINDPTLQQCVAATFQRTRFRSFNGDPIIISYPINFE